MPMCCGSTAQDKVVRLSLNDGRRQALLERNAIDPQVGAQVVLVNAQIAAGGGGGIGGGSSRPFVTGVTPVVGSRGAIGFQPVITNIREGIGFSAMAVVTGDRRYVRLSVAPFFSQVIGVDSFTIPSGR